MKQVLAMVLLMLALPLIVAAAPISGLVNTGLATPGQLEPSWTAFVTGVPYVTEDTLFPFSTDPGDAAWAWLANDSSSRWITPQQSYATDGSKPDDAPGGYDWYLTFDLTGFDPATAMFTFRYLADNHLAQVQLNGNQVFVGPGLGSTEALAWSGSYLINSGFQSGLNTLYVQTLNSSVPEGTFGNPAGLRFEFLSSSVAAAAPIPEPATFGLAGLALLGVAICRRQS